MKTPLPLSKVVLICIALLFLSATAMAVVPINGTAFITPTKALYNTTDDIRLYVYGMADVDWDKDVVGSDRIDDDVLIFYNNGTEGWNKTFIDSSFNDARGTTSFDLDGDGDLDIISTSATSGDFVWYENDGSDDYTKRNIDLALDTPSMEPRAVDFDGDGDLDIAQADRTEVMWWRNDGGSPATFSKQAITTAVTGQFELPADVDNDGDMDFFFSDGGADRIDWFENDGAASPTFTRRSIKTGMDGLIFIIACDFDGDGDLDVAAGVMNADEVRWFENPGDASLTNWNSTVIISSIDAPSGMACGDIDKDGDFDIANTAAATNDTVNWLENNGTGGFTYHLVDTLGDPWQVYIQDLNGSGNMDLVLTSQTDGDQLWYVGDGAGGFTRVVVNNSATGAPRYAVAVDQDKDGDPESYYINLFKDDVFNFTLDVINVTTYNTGQLIINNGNFTGATFLETWTAQVFAFDGTSNSTEATNVSFTFWAPPPPSPAFSYGLRTRNITHNDSLMTNINRTGEIIYRLNVTELVLQSNNCSLELQLLNDSFDRIPLFVEQSGASAPPGEQWCEITYEVHKVANGDIIDYVVAYDNLTAQDFNFGHLVTNDSASDRTFTAEDYVITWKANTGIGFTTTIDGEGNTYAQGGNWMFNNIIVPSHTSGLLLVRRTYTGGNVSYGECNPIFCPVTGFFADNMTVEYRLYDHIIDLHIDPNGNKYSNAFFSTNFLDPCAGNMTTVACVTGWPASLNSPTVTTGIMGNRTVSLGWAWWQNITEGSNTFFTTDADGDQVYAQSPSSSDGQINNITQYRWAFPRTESWVNADVYISFMIMNQIPLNVSEGAEQLETDIIWTPNVTSPQVINTSVTFTATNTTPIDIFYWDFGDNTTFAVGNPASHVFSTNGSFNVCVIGQDFTATNLTFCNTYRIATRGVLSFDFSPVQPGALDLVTFNMTFVPGEPDINASTFAWDFNTNGTTDATTENATFTFVDPTVYNTTLTVVDTVGFTYVVSQNVTANGLIIKVFDEATPSVALVFNVTLSNGTLSLTNNTQGTFIWPNATSGIPTGLVTATIDADGYQTRNFVFTFNQGAPVNLTAFLLLTTDGVFPTFLVVNGQQQPIEGALITAARNIGGVFLTVEQTTTDAAGSTIMFLDPFTTYRITVFAAGFDLFVTNIQPQPIIFLIVLGGPGGTQLTQRADYSFSNILPMDTTTITNGTDIRFLVSDPLGRIQEANLTIFNNDGLEVSSTVVTSTPSFLEIVVNTGTLNLSTQGTIKLRAVGFVDLGGNNTTTIDQVYTLFGFYQDESTASGIESLRLEIASGSGEFALWFLGLFFTFIFTAWASSQLGFGGGIMAMLIAGVFVIFGFLPWQIYGLAIVAALYVYRTRATRL